MSINTCVVTINGKTFTSTSHSGFSIGVINGNVVIDDETIYVADQKEVNIQIHGNVERLKVSACHQVFVTGDVGDVQTQSGDVTCDNVSGSVKTMSGDVRCGKVGGNVKTMSGDIK